MENNGIFASLSAPKPPMFLIVEYDWNDVVSSIVKTKLLIAKKKNFFC